MAFSNRKRNLLLFLFPVHPQHISMPPLLLQPPRCLTHHLPPAGFSGVNYKCGQGIIFFSLFFGRRTRTALIIQKKQQSSASSQRHHLTSHFCPIYSSSDPACPFKARGKSLLKQKHSSKKSISKTSKRHHLNRFCPASGQPKPPCRASGSHHGAGAVWAAVASQQDPVQQQWW